MIRTIQSKDWPNIDRVQRACFPASAIESVEALRSIAVAAPEMCAVAEEQNELLGYMLAHPWIPDDLPPLDVPLPGFPSDAKWLFIHDLALLPSARGSGLAGGMVRRLLAIADELGMAGASLLSVQGTAGFWAQFGFVDRPELTERFRERVFGFYEIDFHFMTAALKARQGKPFTPPRL